MSWSEGICGTGIEYNEEFIEKIGGTVVGGVIGEIPMMYSTPPLSAALIKVGDKEVVLWEKYDGFHAWEEGDGGNHQLSLEMREL